MDRPELLPASPARTCLLVMTWLWSTTRPVPQRSTGLPSSSLNRDRVVARDDELGTEHLGQPQVAAELSLRSAALRDVLLAHDRKLRVPTEWQQKSGAFHRADNALEGDGLARCGEAEAV